MDMSCGEPTKDRMHELSAVLAQNHFEVSPSEDGALCVIFGGVRLAALWMAESDTIPMTSDHMKKRTHVTAWQTSRKPSPST